MMVTWAVELLVRSEHFEIFLSFDISVIFHFTFFPVNELSGDNLETENVSGFCSSQNLSVGLPGEAELSRAGVEAEIFVRILQ